MQVETLLFSAERLNAHLTAGGIVQVSTYLKSTIYKHRHAETLGGITRLYCLIDGLPHHLEFA